jgi:hypothetical protein
VIQSSPDWEATHISCASPFYFVNQPTSKPPHLFRAQPANHPRNSGGSLTDCFYHETHINACMMRRNPCNLGDAKRTSKRFHVFGGRDHTHSPYIHCCPLRPRLCCFAVIAYNCTRVFHMPSANSCQQIKRDASSPPLSAYFARKTALPSCHVIAKKRVCGHLR